MIDWDKVRPGDKLVFGYLTVDKIHGDVVLVKTDNGTVFSFHKEYFVHHYPQLFSIGDKVRVNDYPEILTVRATENDWIWVKSESGSPVTYHKSLLTHA